MGNQLSASIGCSWVTLDADFGGLKIRVSAVRFPPLATISNQVALTLYAPWCRVTWFRSEVVILIDYCSEITVNLTGRSEPTTFQAASQDALARGGAV